jgi:hypothetical protein
MANWHILSGQLLKGEATLDKRKISKKCEMKNTCIINHYIINLNFIDIGGIDDHHCLDFLFIIINLQWRSSYHIRS